MNIHYFWWPITVAILFSLHAYVSFFNKGATGWKPFLMVWVVSLLLSPLWATISRVSKNLLFDGMLFDLIIFTTYAVTFMILEQHYLSFKLTNYAGIAMVIVGMILIKQ